MMPPFVPSPCIKGDNRKGIEWYRGNGMGAKTLGCMLCRRTSLPLWPTLPLGVPRVRDRLRKREQALSLVVVQRQ